MRMDLLALMVIKSVLIESFIPAWLKRYAILRKTIEGYPDSVPSLTSNTIKTLLNMHVFHSSRHLQSKLMLYFSHASMVQVQYKSKWFNPLY